MEVFVKSLEPLEGIIHDAANVLNISAEWSMGGIIGECWTCYRGVVRIQRPDGTRWEEQTGASTITSGILPITVSLDVSSWTVGNYAIYAWVEKYESLQWRPIVGTVVSHSFRLVKAAIEHVVNISSTPVSTSGTIDTTPFVTPASIVLIEDIYTIKVDSLLSVANEYYEFVGWSDGNLEVSRDILVDETKNLTATYKKVECQEGAIKCENYGVAPYKQMVCTNGAWQDYKTNVTECGYVPPCSPIGGTKNVVYCPDGVTWKSREVCQADGTWKKGTQTCPDGIACPIHPWFCEEMITGVPNWALLAGIITSVVVIGTVGYMVVKKKK